MQNKATELICEARNIEDTAQRLTQERDQLRQEFEELKTQAFDPELADVCPTCGHLFTAEEITAMRGKLYTCWHAEQTAKRNAIRERGRKLNEDITAHLAKAKELHTKADDLQVTAKALFATIPQTAGVPSREAIANRTPEYLAIGAEIDELKAQRQALYDKPTEKRDATALREAKSECIADIKRLTLALAGREEMEKASKRIADLEKQVQETAQAIADLEREDDTIMLFNRAKTEAVESKINGLFEVTRFKMFAKQINGQEVETCEATADNVPFSTLNTAMRINVGLDIINAMCRAYDITVPIFIDNAEAVNQLLPTQSQMVKLAVSTETTLTLTET